MALLILGIFIVAFTAFRIYTNKFFNPYTLTLIYGKKGCGKSTVAQKYIYQHYKHGWHIYYNEGDSRFKYGTAIDASHLWTVDFKPHSLLIIDEVNLLWDNREFKTFPKELGAWFRLQRHYKVKVILFSQTADADKKIRDLTDKVYLCKRFMQVLIYCVPYEKEIIYIEPKKQGMISGFIDHYKKLSFGPIGCNFCWLPYWIKFHDSFQDVLKKEENNEHNTIGTTGNNGDSRRVSSVSASGQDNRQKTRGERFRQDKR